MPSFLKPPAKQCSMCQHSLVTNTSSNAIVCDVCFECLPWLHHHCLTCASPIPDKIQICGSCVTSNPPIHYTVSVFNYQYPLNQWLSNLKFNRQLTHVAWLAEQLSHKILTHFNGDLPDALIPVPLHNQRVKERGFNQAALIAQHVATRLKLPLLTHVVKRIEPTSPQTGLSADLRRSNLNRAFKVFNPLPHHIGIIDDVITTGSTVNALSKVLKQSGCQRVDAWSIVKANLKNN